MSALYELSDVKGRVSFILALWVSCASRVSPQIALAGCVGAAAQWAQSERGPRVLRTALRRLVRLLLGQWKRFRGPAAGAAKAMVTPYPLEYVG